MFKEMSNKVKGLIAACVCFFCIGLVGCFPQVFGIGDGFFSDTESALSEVALAKVVKGHPKVALFGIGQADKALLVINSPSYVFGDAIKSFSREAALDAGLTAAESTIALLAFDKVQGLTADFFANRTDVTPEQKAEVARKMVTLLQKVCRAEIHQKK